MSFQCNKKKTKVPVMAPGREPVGVQAQPSSLPPAIPATCAPLGTAIPAGLSVSAQPSLHTHSSVTDGQQLGKLAVRTPALGGRVALWKGQCPGMDAATEGRSRRMSQQCLFH